MSKYRLNFSKNFSNELKIFSELNKNLDVVETICDILDNVLPKGDKTSYSDLFEEAKRISY